MALTDLSSSADLVSSYNNLKNAQQYATQWAQAIVNNSTALAANALWAANASEQDLAFVQEAVSAANAYLAVTVTLPIGE